MTDPNDVKDSLRILAERDDLEGVVLIARLTDGSTVVYSFGPDLEEGEAVDQLLDYAKKAIRAPT